MVPYYKFLLQSGDFEKRVELLKKKLEFCTVCPRMCGVDRIAGKIGACRTGSRAMVASFCVHRGEEPCISGSKGSGAVFFAGCNLACIYCQNYEISQEWEEGKGEASPEMLAEMFLELESLGAHNINWVSPGHVVPQAVEALYIAARRGLSIPVVYNSNGYDSLETLRLLEGIVDIYMPDLKYYNDETAEELSQVRDYTEHAKSAIKEMWRQVGRLEIDEEGVASKGLLVRHLVLPENMSQSVDVLKFLAGEISPDVAVSLMAQYYPAHLAETNPKLARVLSSAEYQKVVDVLDKLGIENGYVQHESAQDNYRPDFSKDGHPFEQ
jgi:putative pyruvate formate lyase activating enzyme